MSASEREEALKAVWNLVEDFQKVTSPEESRTLYGDYLAQFPPPPGVSIDRLDASGVAGEVVVAAGVVPDATVLYLHGGGYLIGDAQSYRSLAARISAAAGARVCVIDYRRAPENPFPAALEDATAACRYLVENGDRGRLAIAGESSGAGLAIATLVKLREDGIPLPAAGVCMSPWVDLEGTGDTMVSNAEHDPLVTKEMVETMAAAYLQGADPRTPLAAPLYADLSDLPPLLILVGTSEALLDDARRLAARAQAAGVDVTLELWDEMVHGWVVHTPNIPEAQRAIDRLGDFIRHHTTRPTGTHL